MNKTVTEATKNFIRQECSLFSIGSQSSLAHIEKYCRELQNYVDEVVHLESKITRTINLLSVNRARVAEITSSSDLVTLKELLDIQISQLIERKKALLLEIGSVKEILEKKQTKVQVYADASGPHSSLVSEEEHSPASSISNRDTLSSSVFDSLCIETVSQIHSQLNQKMIDHYAEYNKIIQDITDITEQSSVEESEKASIYSIIAPGWVADNHPRITHALRTVFGLRIISAGNFFKEVWRKSSSSEVYVTSAPDATDVLICTVHFLRTHLLRSSLFLMGALFVLAHTIWGTSAIALSFWDASPAGASAAILLSVLVSGSWTALGVYHFVLSWTIGYTVHECAPNESSEEVKERRILSLYPMYAANILAVMGVSFLATLGLVFLSSVLFSFWSQIVIYLISMAIGMYPIYISSVGACFVYEKSKASLPLRISALGMLGVSCALCLFTVVYGTKTLLRL
ncbi:hypothetical protein NECID01_0143 [Nematocida sp. AWRm77]|nr:hypothetical protein NECID01_0143 [Nematocida sp. AWRm77]